MKVKIGKRVENIVTKEVIANHEQFCFQKLPATEVSESVCIGKGFKLVTFPIVIINLTKSNS